MFEAFALGLLSQSSLLIGGLIVYWVAVPPRFIGLLAGFGAGAPMPASPP